MTLNPHHAALVVKVIAMEFFGKLALERGIDVD
jgi:hypothetical protein